MSVRVGLVDIVRDFIAVHHRFRALFEQFRAGTVHFEDVKHLVADGDSSVLFRLKERVHGLFRDREPELPLRRGEALFDLAIGSLFHEALKFRENLYQIEVYGPKVRALRAEGGGAADGLLTEFEKILRAASDRLGESLRETEALLEQTRRQLPGLLTELAAVEDAEVGFVTRFVLAERESVEGVYPDGVLGLLEGVHGDLLSAYRCAIRSHLASAHFENAQRLIDEARGLPGADACADLDPLSAYASGMQAYRDGRYAESIEQLRNWLSVGAPSAGQVELAKAVMGRLPKLVDATEHADLIREARDLAKQLPDPS